METVKEQVEQGIFVDDIDSPHVTENGGGIEAIYRYCAKHPPKGAHFGGSVLYDDGTLEFISMTDPSKLTEQETAVNEVELVSQTGLTNDCGWEFCHPSPRIPATDDPELRNVEAEVVPGFFD